MGEQRKLQMEVDKKKKEIEQQTQEIELLTKELATAQYGCRSREDHISHLIKEASGQGSVLMEREKLMSHSIVELSSKEAHGVELQVASSRLFWEFEAKQNAILEFLKKLEASLATAVSSEEKAFIHKVEAETTAILRSVEHLPDRILEFLKGCKFMKVEPQHMETVKLYSKSRLSV